MSETPTDATPTGRSGNSAAAPFCLWVVAQIVALLIAWCGVRPYAGAAAFSFADALPILLVTQIAVASLLMEPLAGSWRVLLVAGAVAFPLTQIAATGDGGFVRGMAAWGVSCLWLILLSGIVRIPIPRWIGQAIVLSWVFGTLIVWYLLGDFRPESPLRALLAAINPLLRAATIL